MSLVVSTATDYLNVDALRSIYVKQQAEERGLLADTFNGYMTQKAMRQQAGDGDRLTDKWPLWSIDQIQGKWNNILREYKVC